MSVAGRVLRQAGEQSEGNDERREEPGGTLDSEFKQQQLETDTRPRTNLKDLEDDLRQWRGVAVGAARKVGARVVATGTSPVEVTPELVQEERYERMAERFGLTATEQLTCGCHVHVAIDSADEGVAALNRSRVWLPVLLAISGNSPFWQGQDSKYASFRAQVMARWPSAGPSEVYESGDQYWSSVAQMVATGVLMDKGMVYADARLSASYPTVEFRVADVCLDVGDAVLLAGLCRALVDTAAAEMAAGKPLQPVATSMVRLATWQAAREGLEGNLVDPVSFHPRPARQVVDSLYEHVRVALEANGDAAAVEQRIGMLFTDGNGARQQRAVLAKTGQMSDVVAHLARITAGQQG